MAEPKTKQKTKNGILPQLLNNPGLSFDKNKDKKANQAANLSILTTLFDRAKHSKKSSLIKKMHHASAIISLILITVMVVSGFLKFVAKMQHSKSSFRAFFAKDAVSQALEVIEFLLAAIVFIISLVTFFTAIYQSVVDKKIDDHDFAMRLMKSSLSLEEMKYAAGMSDKESDQAKIMKNYKENTPCDVAAVKAACEEIANNIKATADKGEALKKINDHIRARNMHYYVLLKEATRSKNRSRITSLAFEAFEILYSTLTIAAEAIGVYYAFVAFKPKNIALGMGISSLISTFAYLMFFVYKWYSVVSSIEGMSEGTRKKSKAHTTVSILVTTIGTTLVSISVLLNILRVLDAAKIIMIDKNLSNTLAIVRFISLFTTIFLGLFSQIVLRIVWKGVLSEKDLAIQKAKNDLDTESCDAVSRVDSHMGLLDDGSPTTSKTVPVLVNNIDPNTQVVVDLSMSGDIVRAISIALPTTNIFVDSATTTNLEVNIGDLQTDFESQGIATAC